MIRLEVRVVLLLSLFPVYMHAQYIQHKGIPYFLNGANIPWNNFGWDFGTHEIWGAGYDSAYFEQVFTDLNAHGINAARFWIHCDGRGSPEFDKNGFVTGVEPRFWADLDDLFARAEAHQVLLIPTLWSFDMFKDYRDVAGTTAGLHKDLVTDPAKLQSYLDIALTPMVQRYAGHCALLAWEIINEPEWSMEISGGGKTAQTVSAQKMQRFVGACATVIHQHSPDKVTVGSASLKWSSHAFSAVGNYWSNDAFRKAGVGPEGYLDFYTVHYFSWMEPWFNPTARSVGDWQLDKPLLIGESPPGCERCPQTPAEMLEATLLKGFAGNFFWSYGAGDRVGEFADFREITQAFANAYPTMLAWRHFCKSQMPQIAALSTPKVFPTALASGQAVQIRWEQPTQEAFNVRLVSSTGQVLQTGSLSANQQEYSFNPLPLASGLYVLEIKKKNAIWRFRLMIR
ncbi:MAG: T9SS type A sorting domain-containing protein [Bacteroidota bacterium]